jgi:hypothetical protein
MTIFRFRQAALLTQLLRKSDLHGVLATLLLLLVAQLGAEWHSYAHAGAGARAVSAQSVLATHADCSDCLGFAPLLSAAGTPATLPRLAPRLPARTPAARRVSLLDQGPLLAFRSRAPPR